MKDIPVLHVEGDSLALAYERALLLLYERGIRIKTQYDKPSDPPSIDATMNITVKNPFSDPMIHKAFPGGIEDLREYVMELSGLKDHWTKNVNDPEDTRWEYTYHWRLNNYGTWKERDPDTGKSRIAGPFRIDQIEMVIKKLSEMPYTRQAQMITWMPNLDPQFYDPPCLQSLHYRIVEDEDGTWYLNCNVRFRSNDAWGANFMNMFGIVHFNHQRIAGPLGERAGRKVSLGRMNWQADSFHIYGKDIGDFEKRFIERSAQPFETRVYNFHDGVVHEIYREAEAGIAEKIREYDRLHPE